MWGTVGSGLGELSSAEIGRVLIGALVRWGADRAGAGVVLELLGHTTEAERSVRSCGAYDREDN